MAVAPFDTLKYAKSLIAGGVPAEEAEAQTNAIWRALQVDLKDLATKDDVARELGELEQRVMAKMAVLFAQHCAGTAPALKTYDPLGGLQLTPFSPRELPPTPFWFPVLSGMAYGLVLVLVILLWSLPDSYFHH